MQTLRLASVVPKKSDSPLDLVVEVAVGSEDFDFEARGTEFPMARVTVEDCLEREENRFALVVLAARRTRQLMKGATPLVHSKNKPAVTALREIAAGKVHFDRPSTDAVQDWIDHMNRSGLY